MTEIRKEWFEKNIKLVLFDFDDTLCIHTQHYEDDAIREAYHIDMLKNNSEWWTMRGCQINKQMEKLLFLCEKENKRVGLISAVDMPRTAGLKIEWVKTHYGYELEDFCACSLKGKVDVIKAITKVYGIKPEEILFIDDLHDNVWNVSALGVNAMSCLEAVNLVNELESYESI